MAGIDLGQLFRSPAQVSVLRALWRAPAALTGRQVQQLAGVHNRTAMQCLEDLERLGVVQRRMAGRAYLYTLLRSHRAIQDLAGPAFMAEQDLSRRFIEDLAKQLKGKCLSAVLYGSHARGEAGAGSDVDLLVIVEDEAAAKAFGAGPQNSAERRMRESWNLILETNVKTRRELVRQWNSPLLRQIRKEGRLVAGVSLEVVTRGRVA